MQHVYTAMNEDLRKALGYIVDAIQRKKMEHLAHICTLFKQQSVVLPQNITSSIWRRFVHSYKDDGYSKIAAKQVCRLLYMASIYASEDDLLHVLETGDPVLFALVAQYGAIDIELFDKTKFVDAYQGLSFARPSGRQKMAFVLQKHLHVVMDTEGESKYQGSQLSDFRRSSFRSDSRSFHDLYEEECMLGEGTYGRVCRFREKDSTGRVVAVKEYKSILDVDGVQREINMLKLFKGHPNIVEYIRMHRKKDIVRVVTEYLPQTLYEFRKASPSTHLETILRFMRDVLNGLHAMHEKGYVFRDLKPNNIMVTCSDFSDPTCSAKIIDLGFLTKETDSSKRIGTIGFLDSNPALKQRNVPLGPYDDMYSFGCTFLYILNGHSMGKTYQHHKLFYQNLKTAIMQTAHIKTLETYIYYIILQCLDPVYQNRPSTAYLMQCIDTLLSGKHVPDDFLYPYKQLETENVLDDYVSPLFRI